MWFYNVLHSYYITGEIGETYFLWWYRCHIYNYIYIYMLACFSLGLKHSLWCDRQYLFNETLPKNWNMAIENNIKKHGGFHGVSSTINTINSTINGGFLPWLIISKGIVYTYGHPVTPCHPRRSKSPMTLRFFASAVFGKVLGDSRDSPRKNVQ